MKNEKNIDEGSEDIQKKVLKFCCHGNILGPRPIESNS